MSAAIEPLRHHFPFRGDSRLALIRVFDDREGLAPGSVPPRVLTEEAAMYLGENICRNLEICPARLTKNKAVCP